VSKPVVITEWERPDADMLSRLQSFGVSTIHEAQGRTGLLAPYIRPIYRGAIAAGSAVTVSLPPGDNLMIHVAVEVCAAGDILIVVPTSYCTDGYFGELLATSLMARGVKGLVIEAGCRDVHALSQVKFPVWSRAISSQGTVKASLGSVNIPVVCAGAQISPGDVVVGDDDGVVVVRRDRAAEVIQAAQARMDKEMATRERLAKGESGLDIYGWRQKLTALGLEYKKSLGTAERDR
jgi:4-hydroxy-4-methyl-2-oxoglutarate aldolase